MADASGNASVEFVLGLFLAGCIVVWLVIHFLVRWYCSGKVRPDPWGDKFSEAVNREDAVEICHRCFEPQKASACFCPHCGGAVGPFNNLMPFEQLFSVGEVVRAGVTEKVHPWTIPGFVLIAISQYLVFAPLYLYFFFKNLSRQRAGETTAADVNPL